jgi:predicted ATP-dependent endonuclease of OLD family
MRLRSVSVERYKRFESRSALTVDSPLIAIVGPNEAGKTSLLAAMEHLSRDVTFDRIEFTDRQPPDGNPYIVFAEYEIEPADREATGDLLDAKTPYVFTLGKRSEDESSVWYLAPRIARDVSVRREVIALLEEATLDERLIVEPTEEGGAPDRTLHESAVVLFDELGGAGEDLPTALIGLVEQFLETLVERGDEAVAKITEAVERLVPLEREANPTDRAGRVLRQRTPPFLLFDDRHRQLEAEYGWAQFSEPTAALGNLCSLAGVDYAEYREVALDRSRRDELHTIERAANEQLREEFAAWSQANISVEFRADAESVQLHVFDTGGRRAIPFDQRSSGLRAFVALIAFAVRYGGGTPPVLLIDEAETHLHYGGQADLVQIFERQRLAQTIIYTTHSIGCLPEDLGTTIRVVAQLENERSEIRNSFWAADRVGAGLTPLMLAMGAEAFAFTPSRFALIGEGPTEAVLLPSVFREARAAGYDGEPLGFQVAPGMARISTAAAAGLELDAGNVAYLVDSDDGGRTNGDKLAERAKEEGRFFILGDGKDEGLCTEDLLDIELYADAVNAVLGMSGRAAKLEIAELPNVARPKAVERWCQARDIDPPGKTDVAVQALVIARQSGRALVDHTRKRQVAALYKRIRNALGIPD